MPTREQRPKVVLEADEVNKLIHSYLIDSGFIHAAFTFKQEARLENSTLGNVIVPRNALTDLLVKALVYREVEVHYKQSPGTCNEPLKLLGPHHCSYVPNRSDEPVALGHHLVRQPHLPPKSTSRQTGAEDTEMVEQESTLDSKQLIFRGVHDAEVYHVVWNPKENNILASAALDGSTVILETVASQPGYKILHKISAESSRQRDISSLDWSPDGMLIAIGTAEGTLRIWSAAKQEIVYQEHHHKAAIVLKFSPSGAHVLCASLDGTITLVDVKKLVFVRNYTHHAGPVLDAVWYNDTCFLTCSSDQTIQMSEVESTYVYRILRGHTSEVNGLALSASSTITGGKRLLSASDDQTARLWSVPPMSQTYVDGNMVPMEGSVGGATGEGCIQVLRGHSGIVKDVRWVPVSSGEEKYAITTSLDNSTRVWDVESGQCLKIFYEADLPIYSVTFSPSYRHFAVGAQGKHTYIYSAETWDKVFTWVEPGIGDGAYALSWHQDGKRLALGMANHTIVILDVAELEQ